MLLPRHADIAKAGTHVTHTHTRIKSGQSSYFWQSPISPYLTLQNRIACVQSLSGTGSLRVGADFIAKFLKGTKVYLSNPTWGNHKNIFTDAGVEWQWYRCVVQFTHSSHLVDPCNRGRLCAI